MTDEQQATITAYVITLNPEITEGELLDLVVQIVADRVLLFLNETELPASMERLIAQVIVSVYKRTEEEQTAGASQSISTVSDNGQSVTYRVTPTQYLFSKSDQELFTGFEKLLSPYRRVHVITS